MRDRRRLFGVLTIALCGAIFLACGFFAGLFFEHTQVAVPLILIAIVCAAIIAGTVKAMRKGSRQT
jgi:hypothetical protein